MPCTPKLAASTPGRECRTWVLPALLLARRPGEPLPCPHRDGSAPPPPPSHPPQTHTHIRTGISLAAFYPNLRAWADRIKARPAVQRGLNVLGSNMVLHHTGGRKGSAGGCTACGRARGPGGGLGCSCMRGRAREMAQERPQQASPDAGRAPGWLPPGLGTPKAVSRAAVLNQAMQCLRACGQGRGVLRRHSLTRRPAPGLTCARTSSADMWKGFLDKAKQRLAGIKPFP